MNITEYVAQEGITAEILEDLGIGTEDGWEGHRYILRLHNPTTGNSMTTPWGQGLAFTSAPTERVDYIADSLISDTWSYQQARDFEDWANEFGLDTDSRKAEAMYKAVGDMVNDVVAFFGGQDKFEYVATEIDRI
ncbi:hypothetical protein [Mycobacteroides abscessus]|uniref:hypothetical protein n=1 Tax=Mycobacteroides abscessus TaxID=36809 RepID=UPI000C25FD55|nr:hypothetical protein [Mycobacteroides abscessus]